MHSSAHVHTYIQLQASKKRARVTRFFEEDSDEDGLARPQATEVGTDTVLNEIQTYVKLDTELVQRHTMPNGLVNEHKFMKDVSKIVPIHYSLFKALAPHVPTEQSAEETFSIAGVLSNDNTHSTSDHTATLVRVNKNREGCTVAEKDVWDVYENKFGKTVEEDMFEPEEEGRTDDEAEDEEEDLENETTENVDD
mmetsp:Transcript_32329/g.53492  ORF Transcript_32329/g.53492 Transcript_32329/m.53492 type:complete len:195 (+) Transcript_32329:69-653(+)|eukprot:CAMPEP_0119301170 /NCGR_PEP_ID=MMETSP1333-20130426/2985_1 /TAXON_ID=418940 /ORGANISM="Scyphosphaera apsteinii, Strain RCC1455" /LENGTH=194 /DNA_ID=CAMNT_0007303171 /DNA_START=64 /DNA_END=648 /DNA_ORIENTATION=-